MASLKEALLSHKPFRRVGDKEWLNTAYSGQEARLWHSEDVLAEYEIQEELERTGPLHSSVYKFMDNYFPKEIEFYQDMMSAKAAKWQLTKTCLTLQENLIGKKIEVTDLRSNPNEKPRVFLWESRHDTPTMGCWELDSYLMTEGQAKRFYDDIEHRKSRLCPENGWPSDE